MSLTKVKEHHSLRKDTVNGGVVNIDKTSYQSYRDAKFVALAKQQEIKKSQHTVENLESEINTLKEDMDDIKSMLMQILNKGE